MKEGENIVKVQNSLNEGDCKVENVQGLTRSVSKTIMTILFCFLTLGVGFLFIFFYRYNKNMIRWLFYEFSSIQQADYFFVQNIDKS